MKYIIWFIFSFLIFANVMVFLSGLQLSNSLQSYEKITRQLHEENLILEQQTYQVSSLQYAKDQAIAMEFIKDQQPITLEKASIAQL